MQEKFIFGIEENEDFLYTEKDSRQIRGVEMRNMQDRLQNSKTYQSRIFRRTALG